MVDQEEEEDNFNYDDLLNDNSDDDCENNNQKEDNKIVNHDEIQKENNNENEEENYGDFEDENFHIESDHISSKPQSHRIKDQVNENNTNSHRSKDNNNTDNKCDDNKRINNEEFLITQPPLKKQSNASIDNTIEKKQSHIMIEKEIILQNHNQFAEASYYVLKTELESLMTKNTFANAGEIATQNQDLMNYLIQLNSILTSLISSTKVIDNKRPIQPQLNNTSSNKKKQINLNKNNTLASSNKLVEVYKREYLRLEHRLKQLSNDHYENSLNKQLAQINEQIHIYETDNKKLKAGQKKCEIDIDIQLKTAKKAEVELKRLEMDYNNTISQHHLLSQKIEKNKASMQRNEEKIKELTKCQENLEKIAKELYNIEEFENVQAEENNELQKEKRRQNLTKKYEVYVKVLESNKKKYESEVGRNQKIICELEEKKNNLLIQIKEKGQVVNGVDNPIINEIIRNDQDNQQSIEISNSLPQSDITQEESKTSENTQTIHNIQQRNQIITNFGNELPFQVKDNDINVTPDFVNVQKEIISNNNVQEDQCKGKQLKEEEIKMQKEENHQAISHQFIIENKKLSEPISSERKRVLIKDQKDNQTIENNNTKDNKINKQIMTPSFLQDSNGIDNIASAIPLNEQSDNNAKKESTMIRKKKSENQIRAEIAYQKNNDESSVDEFDNLDDIVI